MNREIKFKIKHHLKDYGESGQLQAQREAVSASFN